MPVTWTKQMATGVPEIDEEHRRLIDQLNHFLDALHNGTSEKVLGELVDFLSEYSVEHFRHEEMMMEQYDCPARVENRRQHVEFQDRLVEVRSRLEREGPTEELAHHIKLAIFNWLVEHIKTVDAQLADSVAVEAERRVGTAWE
ncbi:MAG: hemerythrin [Planctomycetota bacterium]|nr:MAG: hemerythrin [Planctomycetota bacterium]